MWSEETIKKAAREYFIQQMQYYNIPAILLQYDSRAVEFNSTDLKNAFLAGAKYIINQIQDE